MKTRDDTEIETATIFAFPAERQIGLIRKTVDVFNAKCSDRALGEPYLRQVSATITRRMVAAGIDDVTIRREVASFSRAVEDEILRQFFDNIAHRHEGRRSHNGGNF